ncbi:MAG: S-layer family protein [Phormidesmis sp. RL_2_1]|nr:S-layer family protein [Phormidesmis sp. RL_2_1]
MDLVCYPVTIAVLGFCWVFPLGSQNPVRAEIIEDGTAGTVVTDLGAYTSITGGTQQLTTLFHSFENFSPETTAVYFELDPTNHSAVDLVLARVTGGNTSFIDGTLGLSGGNSPDLFLINPNGITFGSGAFLDLPGSLMVSTADSVLFADELNFSSSHPTAPPLLTLSTPIGLQFGATATPITVEGSFLEVLPGESFGFFGGDVTLSGAFVSAPAGVLAIGSVSSGSRVAIAGDTLLADYANVSEFQDILLNQATFADVSGDGGGRFQLQGRVVSLTEEAFLAADNFGATDGGTVSIRGSEQVLLSGPNDPLAFSTAIFSGAFSTGQGNNLLIETDQLILSELVNVAVDAGDAGAAGNLTINATEIHLISSMEPVSGPVLSAETFGSGQGGDIILTADVLTVDNATITTSTFINGNAGNINLKVGTLELSNLAQIDSATLGSGNGGELNVTATESISITGNDVVLGNAFSSGFFVSADPGSTGSAGNLSLTAPVISIRDGGTVSANTFGSGNAGSIMIRAEELYVAEPIFSLTAVSGIVTTVVPGASGQGGSIDIKANRVRVFNGGQITAYTQGSGNAGNLNIQAGEIQVTGASNTLLLPSAITATSSTAASAGSIRIAGGLVSIENGAEISVSSTQGGGAGDLEISADSVYLNDGFLSGNVSAGIGGNLNLSTQDLLLLRNGSLISTSATDTATGGNIFLNAPIIIGTDNSDIIANAVFGSGGNVNITTDLLLGLKFREQRTPMSDITVSSEFGLSGNVEISNINTDPVSSLVALPENLLDASRQIAPRCEANEGSFTITGRGGLPPTPAQDVTHSPWLDFRVTDHHISATDHHISSGEPLEVVSVEPLAEADTWHVNPVGQIELTAVVNSKPRIHDKATCSQ